MLTRQPGHRPSLLAILQLPFLRPYINSFAARTAASGRPLPYLPFMELLLKQPPVLDEAKPEDHEERKGSEGPSEERSPRISRASRYEAASPFRRPHSASPNREGLAKEEREVVSHFEAPKRRISHPDVNPFPSQCQPLPKNSPPKPPARKQTPSPSPKPSVSPSKGAKPRRVHQYVHNRPGSAPQQHHGFPTAD